VALRAPFRCSILISFRPIMGFAQHDLSAIGGICRELEPRQRCFNIAQAICRIRAPVSVFWFRLSLER
jgi:hypothetical protein